MRIRWTDSALEDFTSICDHSNAHFGPTRGRRTALQIYEAVDSLTDFLYIGRFDRKPGTSELVISGLPFLVVYRLKDEIVEDHTHFAWRTKVALNQLSSLALSAKSA